MGMDPNMRRLVLGYNVHPKTLLAQSQILSLTDKAIIKKIQIARENSMGSGLE